MIKVSAKLVIPVVTTVALAAGAVASSLWFVREPLPQRSGDVQLSQIQGPVDIARDSNGVPHIWGDSLRDVYFAQGYAHAQERMFELDVLRRQAYGELADLVGPNERARTADTVAHRLNFAELAKRDMESAGSHSGTALRGYADGVNTYLGSRPLSQIDTAYSVLGSVIDLKPMRPWQPEDSLAIFKLRTFIDDTSIENELARAQAYRTMRDTHLVDALFPPFPTDLNPMIIETGSDSSAEPSEETVESIEEDAPGRDETAPPQPPAVTPSTSTAPRASEQRESESDLQVPSEQQTQPEQQPQGTGGQPADNEPSSDEPRLDKTTLALTPEVGDPVTAQLLSDTLQDLRTARQVWGGSTLHPGIAVAVSGQRSSTGHPLVAGTAHGRINGPRPWIQNGLYCTSTSEACPIYVSGFSMPGVPGVLMGRTRTTAWSLATAGADQGDVFLEYLRGDEVATSTGWESVTSDGEGQQRREATGHGPIIASAAIPDTANDRVAVAISWAGAQPADNLGGFLDIAVADSADGVDAALGDITAPAWAVAYADHKDVGLRITGLIPVRGSGPEPGVSAGTWPRLGYDNAWRWRGFFKAYDRAVVRNPHSGVIVASAQQALGGTTTLGADADPGYRAGRLHEILGAGGAGTVDAELLEAALGDTRDNFAATVVPTLLTVPLQNNPDIPSPEFLAPALADLQEWAEGGYDTSSESPGAAYYAAVLSNLVRLTFADETGMATRTEDSGQRIEALRLMLADPANPLWDNKSTASLVERRGQVVSSAMYRARQELTADYAKETSAWDWQHIHEVKPRVWPLGQPHAAWWLKGITNPDGSKVPGTVHSVFATPWGLTVERDYEATTYPVASFVATLNPPADLGRGESAQPLNDQWIVPLGVSTHLGSSWFDDQREPWADRELLPWAFATTPQSAEVVLSMRPE